MGIPALTGRGLGHDADLVKVSAVAGVHAELSSDARVQLFLFQQFLMLFLLTPITGAMALAAHAIVGEKQARTLEPLLATPITTFELLTAKVFGALVPTLAISLLGLALYAGGIVLFAEPGVARAMASARTLLLVAAGRAGGGAGLAAGGDSDLVARQRRAHGAAVRRAHHHPADRHSGRPVHRLALADGNALGVIGLGLLVVWVLLTLLSVVVFERESILTRWR